MFFILSHVTFCSCTYSGYRESGTAAINTVSVLKQLRQAHQARAYRIYNVCACIITQCWLLQKKHTASILSQAACFTKLHPVPFTKTTAPTSLQHRDILRYRTAFWRFSSATIISTTTLYLTTKGGYRWINLAQSLSIGQLSLTTWGLRSRDIYFWKNARTPAVSNRKRFTAKDPSNLVSWKVLPSRNHHQDILSTGDGQHVRQAAAGRVFSWTSDNDQR